MAKSIKVSTTALIETGPGIVSGIVVSSHTSGTLKLEDSVGGGQNVLIDTFSFPTGSGVYKFPEPLPFTNGLFATVGGTLNGWLILSG